MKFRISDIKLANFYFQSSFLLTSFPTIFNNYFGDIDDDTVAYLDRNLHIGQTIKEVYEQLLSTIDMNHCFKLDTVSQWEYLEGIKFLFLFGLLSREIVGKSKILFVCFSY